MKKLSLAIVVAVLLGACGQPESVVAIDEPAAGEFAFADDNERMLYTLGVLLAENIAQINLTEDEYELVSTGMRDAIGSTPPRVDVDVYGPQIQEFVNSRIQSVAEGGQADTEQEKVASAAFADEIAAEPGAERLPSGVVYLLITEGDGANPSADDTVTVHYHGTLRDGTIFDSSVDRGQPATFPLSQVISCWTEGVQKIKVGGKAKLLCPSDVAYGDSGRPGIPGGAALLFDVELLSID